MLDYGLSSQQLTVICALSSGATMNAAAQQAGVHRNTIHNWHRNLIPFQQALIDAQYDRALLFREMTETLVDLAIQTLHDILADEKAPAGVRLKAALAVIQTASTPPAPKKQIEIEIEKFVVHQTGPKNVTGDQLEPAPPVHNNAQPDAETVPASQEQISPGQNSHNPAQIRSENSKIGRNEQCPCGSGLKHKRCCLDKPRAQAA